nr:hypothetical protein [Corynebacterium otitidis]
MEAKTNTTLETTDVPTAASTTGSLPIASARCPHSASAASTPTAYIAKT